MSPTSAWQALMATLQHLELYLSWSVALEKCHQVQQDQQPTSHGAIIWIKWGERKRNQIAPSKHLSPCTSYRKVFLGVGELSEVCRNINLASFSNRVKFTFLDSSTISPRAKSRFTVLAENTEYWMSFGVASYSGWDHSHSSANPSPEGELDLVLHI